MRRIAEMAKQRKVALMINKKLEIIESIDAVSLYTIRAEKYGTYIAQLTVANIKKDALRFEVYKKSMEISFRKAASKMTKTGKYKRLMKRCVCMYVSIYVHCECFVLDL